MHLAENLSMLCFFSFDKTRVNKTKITSYQVYTIKIV